MTATLTEVSSAGREKALWQSFAEDRDPGARAELVAIYMPVARRMARRYAGIAEPYDDLVQVASLGLLNAIERFDPSREIPFLGFAKPTIMGELKRYFRDKVWTIRVPRSIHDRIGRIESVSAEMADELSRPPSAKELAARLKLDLDEVLEALEARDNRRPLGLDVPIRGADGEDGSSPEWVGEVDGGYELVDDRLTLESVLPGLGAREREILHLRFVEDLPQSKIATQIGCSQMHVSRLLRGTLERLREDVESAVPVQDAA